MHERIRVWQRLVLGGVVIAGAGGCAHALAARANPPAEACPAGTSASVRWVHSGEPAAPSGWCAAVGAPVVRAGERRPAAAADSVLVVTWNTHVGGGDLRRLVADVRSGRLTGGAPAGDFVLLLQEVYRAGDAVPRAAPGQIAPRGVLERTPSGRRTDVVADAEALDLNLLYVPSMRNGVAADLPAEDKGNAILSTLPLNDAAALELPFEAQRRVVALAAVRASTAAGRPWRLDLASVHLDLRSRMTRLWASTGEGRLRQARALPRALPPRGAAVLGGDLNTWVAGAAEPAPTYLRRGFGGGRAGASFATFVGPLGMARQLDHLFVRGARASPARRVDDRYGSDHHPVWTWVYPAASEHGGE